jgi:hypothetical protein
VTLSLPRRPPLWAVVAFGCGFALALSPNIVEVYGIHNDYEMLTLREHGLLYHEAPHLFAIARPFSALFSNLPLLLVDSIADFRWTRILSTLTVWLLGCQMMSICLQHLRTSAFHAWVVTLSTFLVPGFIYSVLNAPAWGAHLVPVFCAFAAYQILSRSNVPALAFGIAVQERDTKVLWVQFRRYCALRWVWLACLVWQVAFYDFPSNALIVTIFPVILILFSQAPRSYRAVIAIRDIGFIAANMVLFWLSSKFLYMPLVKLTSLPMSATSPWSRFQARVDATYNMSLNTDPQEMLSRLKEIATVAGNLWWLPQTRLYIAVAVLIALAAVLGLAAARRSKTPPTDAVPAYVRAFTIAVPLICFLTASSPIVIAAGAFVSYRTVVVPTAIVGIIVLWGVDDLVRSTVRLLSTAAAGIAAHVAMAAIALTAVAGNFQQNLLTMRLARSETAYFRGIVGEAITKGSTAVVLVDPRPISLPEDHAIVYDKKGKAIPPYELACFSGYCLQTGSVVTVLGREMGANLQVVASFREGEPMPITCDMLAAPDLPAGVPDEMTKEVEWLRGLKPMCVNYGLAWHDLSARIAP